MPSRLGQGQNITLALPIKMNATGGLYYTQDAGRNATASNDSNTTTASAELERGSSELSDILGVWVTGVICLLGFAGNILSFMVLLQAFRRSPMFYVLRAVAVSDALFLFSVFVMQTIVNMHPDTGLLQWCYTYRGYIQYSLWPVLMMTQMSTVWLTVLVSIERYIAICYPLMASSYCTLRKVQQAVLLIFSVSVIYNVARYWEFEVANNISLQKTVIGSHEIYRYLYSCALYSLFLFFVPLGLLIFLNLKLVLALNRGKKQWQTLQFRQKKEQNLTTIPLTIVLVFCVCGTPALVVNVIDSIYPDIFMVYPSYVTFMVVANLLVVSNSACNFIIYCLLGKKFRSKLLELCHCNCHRSYRVVTHLVTNTQTTHA